jgi:hypothetical protein
MAIESTGNDIVIEWDGEVRGPDDIGITMFSIVISSQKYWFEGRYTFAPNGNDFTVLIGNFGIPNRNLAGSTSDALRRRFPIQLVPNIKHAIDMFFVGDHLTAGFHLFPGSKGKCLKVDYPGSWIMTSA